MSRTLCPVCLAKLERGPDCAQCGLDTTLFLRISLLSDKLYNKGLAELRLSYLSAGVETLTKCIEVNKNNIQGRNLLGLALFEMGRVGDAIRHWIISTQLLSENNPATRYLDSVYKSPQTLEALNKAAEMYNAALENIHQRSIDMSIIQLRKAIEINPLLVDALNLLTFCFLIRAEVDSAEQTARRVLQIDRTNPLATNYKSLIAAAKPPAAQHTGPSRRTQPGFVPYQPALVEEKKSNRLRIFDLLFFVLGGVLAAVVMYFFIMPAQVRNAEAERDAVTENYRSAAAQLTEDLRQLQESHSTLSAMYDLQAQALEGAADESERRGRTIEVHNARIAMEAGEYTQAIELIASLSDAGLDADVRTMLAEIRQWAYPLHGAALFAIGQREYAEEYFDRALETFERAWAFLAPPPGVQEHDPLWPQLLFALAQMRMDTFVDHAAAAHVLNILREIEPPFRPADVQAMIAQIEGDDEADD